MAEEEKGLQSATEEIQSAEDYVAAINRLKETTVPKDQYDKLVKDHEVVVKALAGEGPVPEGVQKQAQRPSTDELIKKFVDAGENNLTNAEYVKTALELRQAIIDEGGTDPFLPNGAKIRPTPQDIAGAQKVADTMQSWLDEATDETGKIDNELFNAFLRKGIAEDGPMMKARLGASKPRSR